MEIQNQTQNQTQAKEYQDVGARMKQVREREEWTQALMAKELEISLPMLQNYESGKNLVSSVVLQRLAKRGYDVNWILTESGTMKVDNRLSAGYNNDLLSSLIANTEIILFENRWQIMPGDKAAIITKLFARYNQSGGIDAEELKWALSLANTNKSAEP